MSKSRGAGESRAAGLPKARSKRTGQPRKHVPIRTCIACRRADGKRELIRVVRSLSAGVQVDATGKAAGRGAYLCRSRACWEQALRGQRLSQALKTTLTKDEIAALREYAATLPETTTGEAKPEVEAATLDHA